MNYKLREISAEDFAQFNENVSRGSFLQTPEMADLMKANGWEVTFLAVQSDKIEMAALLGAKSMTGGKHYEIQYGPIYQEYQEAVEKFFYKELRQFVKEHGGMELLVIPNTNYQEFDSSGHPLTAENQKFIADMQELGYNHTGLEVGYNQRGESTWHYIKDLSEIADDKKLLKSYTKDGQYSVKKTQQFGIRVRPLAYEELDKFKKITSETSERRGYDDHDLAYYQSLYKTFGDKAEFLVAEINFADYEKAIVTQIDKLTGQIEKTKKEGKRKELENQLETQKVRLAEAREFIAEHGREDIILAGSLFIYGASETIYLFSGSYEAFKKLYAPFAIQHYVMKKTLNKGVKSYNFFGIAGTFDGTDGVLHFKQNFSGYVVRKVGYFTYYPKPLKHKILSMAKTILGRK
ncbi:aminoacyltransferase [Lactococcus muris]|uniref:Aminoacyltransferase FemA n=1 Tax=Lactococcus muris TaxID=2941330 RepID=A0ABV4D9H3_9LACT|nr:MULTISPECIES: aminoacyltransferase [Lactococcus]MBL3715565.1 peptidoglycan bridge formation glycyltransferase FemA/FemB family protein [Lactococcus garvieae]HAP15466.1 aminoacyltransferase [Lactococcus sp.]